MKYWRRCRLKTTNRRLTQKAAAQMTHSGALAAMSGITASCALPANTSSDISTASVRLMPLLTMATPVMNDHAVRPTEMPDISRAPTQNSGWRAVWAKASMRSPTQWPSRPGADKSP